MSAVSVGYRSAMVLGTISPKTTEIMVSETRTPALAIDSAVSGPSVGQRASSGVMRGVMTASAYAPSAIPDRVMPTWDAAI